MILVEIPVTDVNTDSVVVSYWFQEARAWVTAGQNIATVETSKAAIDVEASASGYLLPLVALGEKVKVGEGLCVIFDSAQELLAHTIKLESEKSISALALSAKRPISVKALALVTQFSISDHELSELSGFITESMINDLVARRSPIDWTDMPTPLHTEEGILRIVLIGGGTGAEQVLDILSTYETQKAVAILDDNPEKWGRYIDGTPIIGHTDRLKELKILSLVDAAIVCISTSVHVRRKFRTYCSNIGLPLVNAIDRSVKIASSCKMGVGNVVCAFTHFGTKTIVGDNNFISAYNSFDHHNRLGNDISTGPGCMTSGNVTIGNCVRLGTGIFMQPRITLGDTCMVASGAVITGDIPQGSILKLAKSNYVLKIKNDIIET
jgi:acetyltransferase-like isoleucine patch superfamily enzyme